VPGWSLVWNELLTKKLPMFLSRLNEMSGGCEKIVPVSGYIQITCTIKGLNDAFEWSQTRVSSTDLKVRTTLYSIINSTT